MSASSAAELDLVKEFRLRRWARQNYVSGEHRSGEWHPIVLDEMQKRDVELTVSPTTGGRSSQFVPLAPTELRRLDEAHDAVVEPNMIQSESRQPDDAISESWM